LCSAFCSGRYASGGLNTNRQTDGVDRIDRDAARQSRDYLLGKLTEARDERGHAARAQEPIDHAAEAAVLVAVH
jgi:hypothetical protein